MFHKTGNNFVRSVLPLVHPVYREDETKRGFWETWTSNATDEATAARLGHVASSTVRSSQLGAVTWYAPRVSLLPLALGSPPIPRYRIVLFARDPVELVISAYRFHREQFAGGEHWVGFGHPSASRVPADCLPRSRCLDGWRTDWGAGNGVDDQWEHVLATPSRLRQDGEQRLAAELSHALDAGRSWLDILKRADERTGVVLEAYRSRFEVELMAEGARALRADTAGLTVLTDELANDFNATVMCILRFFTEVHPALDKERALGAAQVLAPSRTPGAEDGRVAAAKLRAQLRPNASWGEMQPLAQRNWELLHNTGGSYDNTHLRESLGRVRFLADAARLVRGDGSDVAARICRQGRVRHQHRPDPVNNAIIQY